jgi:hypothetical protein
MNDALQKFKQVGLLQVVLCMMLALVWLLLAPTAVAFAQSAGASQAITETQSITETEAAPAAEAAPAEAPAEEAVVAPADHQAAVPADKFCIEGSVINFDEKPLTDGWNITLAELDEQGNPNPNGLVQTTTSDNKGNFKFEDGLRSGKWQLTKEPKEGWDAVTPDAFIVDLKPGMKECLKVRFKQRPVIEVIVIKVDDEYNPLANWVMRAEPGRGNVFAVAKELTTDNSGQVVFQLTPGLWVFTEKAPKGVKFTPVIPFNGRLELNVTAPGPHTVFFKNRLTGDNGCIETYKYDEPSDEVRIPLPGWKIEVRRANGSLAASNVTNADGYVKFSNLPPGPYTVVEETRVGWKPVESTSYNVTVQGGDTCEIVEFVNVQDPPGFCLEGRKIDTNGKVGIPGWKIWAEPVDKGGYPKPDESRLETTTDGSGAFRFDFPSDDYRISGASYKVCEEKREGWLPHTSTCYTVRLPMQPGACTKVPVFENQQVGHGRSTTYSSSGGCRIVHTVRRGEGLYAIGAHYGVSANAVLNANGWVRNRAHYYLYPGDQVCIP